jgi:hypothetical protein
MIVDQVVFDAKTGKHSRVQVDRDVITETQALLLRDEAARQENRTRRIAELREQILDNVLLGTEPQPDHRREYAQLIEAMKRERGE